MGQTWKPRENSASGLGKPLGKKLNWCATGKGIKRAWEVEERGFQGSFDRSYLAVLGWSMPGLNWVELDLRAWRIQFS